MLRTQRLWVALAAAMSHWALLAAIQIGSFCAYLMPAGSLPADAPFYLSAIPFIQGQAILVSAALGLLAWLFSFNRIVRWAILPIHLAFTLFVLADELIYKIFFDHLRPSLFELGSSVNLDVGRSSLSTETDFVFWIAAVIALCGETWLVTTLIRPPTSRPPLVPFAAASILLLASLPSLTSSRYYHLNEHPVVVAAQDWGSGSLIKSIEHRKHDGPRTVLEEGMADTDPRLGELEQSSVRTAVRHPNIVMVVMESVAARNLLGADGLPSGLYAPNLARLARRAVTFDSMYVPYPATTRSMVALHTGGRQITGSGLAALEHPYQGPLLGSTLRNLGYATALFSSERLDVEDEGVFLEQVGFDKFQDFETDVASHFRENEIHSWGAREEYTVGLIDKWLNADRDTRKPFFLEYMTVATHHPYGVPPDYRPPFAGKDALSQYRNSIHYTDRAIGVLLELLARKGLLDDTIIVVTGDHGEGFGDIHPLNLVHKNFLYEENVRGFFMLSDPKWKLAEPVRSSRVISNGDIMPTLLTLLGAPEPSLPGRNVLEASLPPRAAFFHKLAQPEQWGVRDGKWKYIAEIRSGKAELYDLETDPFEHKNLVAHEAARAKEYSARCEDWFIRSDAEYIARVKDYRPPGGRTLRPDEFRTPGPKLQSVGFTSDKGSFFESSNIGEGHRPVAWVSWVSDGRFRHGRWLWTAPSGTKIWTEMDIRGDWDSTYISLTGNLPMEPGKWSVQLWQEGRPGLLSRFTVAGTKLAHR